MRSNINPDLAEKSNSSRTLFNSILNETMRRTIVGDCKKSYMKRHKNKCNINSVLVVLYVCIAFSLLSCPSITDLCRKLKEIVEGLNLPLSQFNVK